MKLNRILAGAAILALGATLITATSASADETSGAFSYTIDGCNATITGYTGDGGDVVVPSSFPSEGGCDYTVTAIGDSAFRQKGLTAVTIPDSVTFIDLFSFDGNIITAVTMGRGVTFINDSAFGGNPGLTSVTFLGNAPSVTVAGSEDGSSFDTSNSNFAITYAYGATGFGTGSTWQGYPLTQPSQPPVTSLSDVTAGVSAGVRSVSLADATFGTASFSHGNQDLTATPTLNVDDLTGAKLGWNVTLQATDLTWTATNGGPDGGSSIPASALFFSGTSAVSSTAGDDWSGNLGTTGTLNSPVTILSTNGGNGAYSGTVNLTLTIPGQTTVGTYAGTLTTTISAAP